MNGDERGFFDLANPVLARIEDVLLADMPPAVRLTIWGIFAAIVSMGLYRILSQQKKINIAGSSTRSLIKELATYDGDFDGLMALTKAVFISSTRHFFIVLGPALLASLPILFLISWLSYSYDERLPVHGEQVEITITPPIAELTWRPSINIVSRSTSEWMIAWPSTAMELSLTNSNNVVILTLPLRHAVGVLHKKMWWNALFANPNGYLPDSAKIELVLIKLPAKKILDYGPDWMRGWETIFFSVLVLCSLLIKFGFRVS